MARTVVFIFLLDTLPEFPLILNRTLHEKFSLSGLNYTLQDCDPNITNSILQKANLERSKNNSNWKLFKTKDDPMDMYVKPSDSLYYEDIILDNSIHDSDENSLEDIQDYNDDMDNYGSLQNIQDLNSNFTKPKTVEAVFPPFLVAIFETLADVTAQTCAGTLLSAHWVVTAASCVGVLGEFYGNSTKSSRYTIVTGSTNPLIDGSIHNVTDILLRPPENEHPKNSSKNSFGTNLAMMKISPGVAVDKVKILNDTEEGIEATVYGWTLVVNESSREVMMPTWISAKKTNSSQCKDSEVTASSTLCFSPELMASANRTKLGAGGPVLVRDQIFGVVLADRVPLPVAPLSAHAWIHALLNVGS